jgi:predicted SprT family Zn-dependent metalloprotease
MSRSKKQSDDIAELKRAIKDRDATIKSLERQLKKLNDELTPSKKEKKKPEVEPSKNSCPECKKNTLKTTDLGPNRQIISCTSCTHRIVVKRNG